MLTDHQQQVRTQLRAHSAVGELLIRQHQDPGLVRHLMVWTMTAGRLHGEPDVRDDAAREAAIVAWAEVIGLIVEKTSIPGRPVELSAKGPYTPVGGDPIWIDLAATLYGSDDDDTGPIG